MSPRRAARFRYDQEMARSSRPFDFVHLPFCALGVKHFLRKKLSRKYHRRLPQFFSNPQFVGVCARRDNHCRGSRTQICYRAHESASSPTTRLGRYLASHAQNFKSVPIAEQARNYCAYNDGGSGAWTVTTDINGACIFKWLPGRTAGLFIKNHRPDICLPASGMRQIGHDQKKRHRSVPHPFVYIFDNNGTPLHVYYCYWDGTIPNAATINQENWSAAGRLRAVLDGKREVGAWKCSRSWLGDTIRIRSRWPLQWLENIIRRG